MAFATIEHDEGHITIVNTDQITYMRQDSYGTAVHFSSGEHIVCPIDFEILANRLFGTIDSQKLLKSMH